MKAAQRGAAAGEQQRRREDLRRQQGGGVLRQQRQPAQHSQQVPAEPTPASPRSVWEHEFAEHPERRRPAERERDIRGHYDSAKPKEHGGIGGQRRERSHGGRVQACPERIEHPREEAYWTPPRADGYPAPLLQAAARTRRSATRTSADGRSTTGPDGESIASSTPPGVRAPPGARRRAGARSGRRSRVGPRGPTRELVRRVDPRGVHGHCWSTRRRPVASSRAPPPDARTPAS